MNHCTNKHNSKGFTILELMIVITIAAILGSFALPEMKYTLNANKLKTAASEMHLSLLLARSEAIKRNGNVTISQSGSGWVVAFSGTELKKYDAVPDNVSVACNGTCPGTVTFDRMGRASPSGTEFRFHMTSTNVSARCVTINLNGKPRVYVDNDDNYANGCS